MPAVLLALRRGVEEAPGGGVLLPGGGIIVTDAAFSLPELLEAGRPGTGAFLDGLPEGAGPAGGLEEEEEEG